MNITNHAKERYLERIQGITDDKTRKQYLAVNNERIEKEILDMYNYSALIYTGQLGGDKTTKDYYMNKDTALVVGGDDIVTIYPIKFNFPEHTQSVVIKDLILAIEKLEDDIYNKQNYKTAVKQDIDCDNQEKLQEIKQLQAEIDLLNYSIKANNSLLEGIDLELKQLFTQRDKYATQLFANTDLKDLG